MIQDGDMMCDASLGCIVCTRLRYSMISISMIERKGFEVLFQDGKARLKPKGSKFDGIVLRVREFYHLKEKFSNGPK